MQTLCQQCTMAGKPAMKTLSPIFSVVLEQGALPPPTKASCDDGDQPAEGAPATSNTTQHKKAWHASALWQQCYVEGLATKLLRGPATQQCCCLTLYLELVADNKTPPANCNRCCASEPGCDMTLPCRPPDCMPKHSVRALSVQYGWHQ